MVAPQGGIQTARAGDDLNTGIMFDLFDYGSRPMSLEEATDRLIVSLREHNQSVVIIDGALRRNPSVGYLPIPGAQAQILLGSEPALRTVMIGRSTPSGPRETVWVVTRMYYQSLFYIVCVAPEGEEFEKLQPIFEQIIRSVELR